jgi:hypothetical protein
MLSLLKKKPEGATGPVTPPWHHNFRNFERLPDTKVVRTAFFVNGAAVAVAVVMVLLFARQEYQLIELKSQIGDWQTRIDRDKRESDQAIALYKKFQADEARLGEIDAFMKYRPPISTLLLRIGQTLPANVALDLFDLRDKGVKLRVSVRGAPDLASGYASSYLQTLRSDPALSAIFGDIQLVNLARNPQTGRLAGDFYLALKSTGKEGDKP